MNSLGARYGRVGTGPHTPQALGPPAGSLFCRAERPGSLRQNQSEPCRLQTDAYRAQDEVRRFQVDRYRSQDARCSRQDPACDPQDDAYSPQDDVYRRQDDPCNAQSRSRSAQNGACRPQTRWRRPQSQGEGGDRAVTTGEGRRAGARQDADQPGRPASPLRFSRTPASVTVPFERVGRAVGRSKAPSPVIPSGGRRATGVEGSGDVGLGAPL